MNNIENIDLILKYESEIKTFDKYFRNIDANIENIQSLFESVPFEVHKYIILKYQSDIKDYAESPDFQSIIFFSNYANKASMYHKENIEFVKELFYIITVFKDFPEVYSNMDFIRCFLDLMPLSLTSDEERLKYQKIKNYLFTIKKYFYEPLVKEEFLSNVNESNKDDLIKLLVNFGKVFMLHCLDVDGIKALGDKNVLSTLVDTNDNIKGILTENVLAELLSQKNYSHEEMDIYLDNISNNEYHEANDVKSLLYYYLKSGYYNIFYQVFSWLDNKEQIKWINNNKQLFFNNIFKSNLLLKDIKKDGYIIFDEYIDYDKLDFSLYELEKIIKDNSSQYRKEQLIKIFTNDANINKLLNSSNFNDLFIAIIKFNIEEINCIYLSDEFKEIVESSGIEYPKFILTEDEPSDEIIEQSSKENIPIVKVLRKIHINIYDDFND